MIIAGFRGTEQKMPAAPLRKPGIGHGCVRRLATYFRLTDDSFRFVKIVFPGGQEHTLPNVVSASGARYTDDREFVWWLKGNTAFVQARDSDGKWLVRSSDCRPVEGQGK